ncbi:metallothionein [Neltuma alba]|uniref:metallothionein n=1 Tax=Neltuma alba TaxID=207710 RepID=UPI0010A3026C|nr:metallothionein-like [Prosopis alba]
MESQSQIREVPLEGTFGNVYCKCGEGWTCVISKTTGPDAGKPYFKCGESCDCSIDGAKVPGEEVKEVGDAASGAYCKCGEGWSCVISRVQPSDAQKGFECAGPCTCAVEAK